MDAAWAVLVSEGPEGLTMARVAARARVAVGGLYRYFDNKDALLGALQARAIDAFGDFLDEALDGIEGPMERIRVSARSWDDFARAEPEHHALLDAWLSDPKPSLSDEAARDVDEAVRPVLATVAQAFEDAVEQGLMRPGDTSVRAYALWAAVHGAGHMRKRERLGAPRADALRECLVDGLLAGWADPRAGETD